MTFSIIIPSYNRADFIGQTLNSVVQQSFSDWECLVIDDGSTDGTKQIVQSFQDPRIKYFYKKNEERSIARNFGIMNAQAPYVCFLDSDDQFLSNHLETIYNHIQKNGFPIGLFCTEIKEVNHGVIRKRRRFDPKAQHPVYFIWENFILPSSICVHRDILDQHQFPNKFPIWEDAHLFLRIAALFPFYYIPEITSVWNVHKGSSVSQNITDVNYRKVKKYIYSVNDLFSSHKEIISPFLDEGAKKKYQMEKLMMFLKSVYNEREWVNFFRIFLFGIRKVDRLEFPKKVWRFIKTA